MKRKKVLIVAHRWPPRYGGLQNAAFLYAEGLAKNYDISVFTSKEKGYDNIVPNGVKMIEGYSFPWLYNKFGIPQPIFTPKAIRLLEKSVKDTDIVIINDRYYISSILASKYAKKYGKKTILILQTPILRYKGLLKTLYKFNNWLAVNVVKDADKIFAVSKDTGRDVLGYYHIKKPFEILYNPTSLSDFTGSSRKFDNFTALFVGRFVSKKGVDLLPEIASRLAPSRIDLITIGDGPEFAKIKKESENLFNLKLLGKITDRNKMVEYYKRAHIFLLTSKHGEAFPLVLGDALAAGLPVVSTNGGTYTEIFSANLGHLCQSYNPEEISSAILKLKADKNLYSLQSKNSKNFARDNLDIKNLANILLNAIKNL